MMSLLIAGIMIGSGAVLGGQKIASGMKSVAKKIAEKAEANKEVLAPEQNNEVAESEINEDEVE